MAEEERCWHCDDATGRAGRADDSLYDNLVFDRGNGPYCPDCWHELFADKAEADVEGLRAIVEMLLSVAHQCYLDGQPKSYQRCTCPPSWPRAGHHHKTCLTHLQDAFREAAEAAKEDTPMPQNDDTPVIHAADCSYNEDGMCSCGRVDDAPAAVRAAELLPSWACFDADEYTDQPPRDSDWDTSGIECEYNDDLESLAAAAMAYRFEIVRLRNDDAPAAARENSDATE